ncbi:MAG: tryptophan--tRNA ligase [Rhodospirillales bacterium]
MPAITRRMFTRRIFSGVQPTGNLHLGNYLGAIRNWARLQNDFEGNLFCVVDLHAVTTWQNPKELCANTREVAAAMLAAGIDPGRNVIFNQSQVAAHAELAWIFNCTARMGWLSRMTQFKEKAGKNRENASVGLFAYPALMAADILVYKATHVPVGEDQKQHLELTRDIAIKFNNDFGKDVFPVAEPMILGAAARVMSLKDGAAKMSKSDPSENSRINMTDDADAVARKIRRAKTDSEPMPENKDGLQDRPEAANLIGVFAALADRDPEDVIKEFAGGPFADFKQQLADLAVSVLGPVQDEMRRLLAAPDHVDKILAEGAVRAEALARPVIAEVQDVMGFLKARR